jgi:hypothetical protein
MAAGLGFKDFQTGEVLTAADVDGYLMQGVWVFASAAARDAAVTAPQEGNFAYLKDTNVTTYYTGSAWANLDTTGMTNPMTTTGDTIYSSSGSTPARLGIGSTGDVLTVSGGVPVWSAPASGGGMTLLSTTTLSGASTTISSISQSYTNLLILITDANGDSNNEVFRVQFNGTANSHDSAVFRNDTGSLSGATNFNGSNFEASKFDDDSTSIAKMSLALNVYNYTSTGVKPFNCSSAVRNDSSSANYGYFVTGRFRASSAISSIVFSPSGGNFSAGTVLIYGVK